MSGIYLVPREETSQLICVVSCVEQVSNSNFYNIIWLNLVYTVPADGNLCSYHLHLVPREGILAISILRSKAKMVRIQTNIFYLFFTFSCPIQRPGSGVKAFLYQCLILDNKNECLIVCVL